MALPIVQLIAAVARNGVIGDGQDMPWRIPEDLELTFDGGVVRGSGWDRNGDFVVKGCYDLDSREVRWTKIYATGRKVVYRGFREGRGIWGTWREDAQRHAGFLVWPI